MNRKGFTLVELLATILIIGLVLGLTAYGIISSVNSAKDTGTALSLSGIKEAARIYSGEFSDDSWKISNSSSDMYFCTTTEELINKGLLDKKANKIEDDNIKLNDYIVVIKDKVTKVVKKEEIFADTEEMNKKLENDKSLSDAYEYCTGNKKPEEIEKKPTIKSNESYTDTININFTDAVFKTKDGQSTKIKETKCGYSESNNGVRSDNVKWDTDDNNIKINNNECEITSLKQDKDYYITVCMTSVNDSVACSNTESVRTKKVMSPSMEVNNGNSVNITYDDKNIKGDVYYYFKSTMDATSDKNVVICDFYGKIFGCESSSSNRIAKATWYRTTDKKIILTYKDSGNVTVTAETRDKSNNFNQSNKEFSPKKIKITLNGNGGSGGTSSFWYYYGFNKYYSDEACTKEITTVSVSTRTGYKFNYYYGNGTSGRSNGQSYISSDGIISSKLAIEINKDATLYANWIANKINIYYHMNGGTLKSNNKSFSTNRQYVTLNGNTLIESYNYGDKLGTDGLYNYNNPGYINIVRDGYKAASGLEWYNQDGKKFSQSTIYNVNDLCDASKADCAATLYVNWVKEDSINGYRCSSSDFYYITTCDTSTCKFTSKNGSSESGTISRNSLSECLTSKYITANSGLNCRLGAGASYGKVTAYSCGTLVEVINKPINGWWYSLNSNCYMSGDYLSNSKPSCSSGGSGGSGGSGDGGSSGGLDNGCPTSAPKKFTKGDTVYCCTPGVTDPTKLTGDQKCQAYKGGADDSEGILKDCTCNNDKDCGTAGTKYRDLRCDKNRTSGSTTGGKYMCAWGTLGNSDVYHCWVR